METFVEWLKNLVRAGGQKAFAIALACGILLWIDRSEVFTLSSGIKETIVVLGVTSGCVALTSLGSAIGKWLYPIVKAEVWKFRARGRAQKYLPRLTEKEKEIIAYLLAKNQTLFTCDSDGEEARTLIASGFIVCALRPGQVFVEGEVPYAIPEYVWAILVKNKDLFPYQPANDDDVETYPWRTSWMAKRI
jgi:hypothetical protein